MQGTGWGGLPRNRLCLGRLLKKRSAASQTTQAKHRSTSATATATAERRRRSERGKRTLERCGVPHSPFSRHALAGAWCRRDAWTCDRTTPATRAIGAWPCQTSARLWVYGISALSAGRPARGGLQNFICGANGPPGCRFRVSER